MDYGNRSEVPLNKLKEIPSCLQGLPFQVGVMLLADTLCLAWQTGVNCKSGCFSE